MGIQSNARAFAAKFKLDEHHNIERFGVIFSIFVVILTMLLTTAFFSAREASKELLSKQALYVTSFNTSRTDLSGEVPGIYVSPDHKRALVMMKFKSPTDVSSDAMNYQGFLTGSNAELKPSFLNFPVRGEIVVFGSSGYLGVVLESDEPFPQQILSLTMRANSELVYQTGDPKIRKDLRDDGSFANHDQWRIYFNPGGSDAVVVDALGAPKISIGEIYAELVVAPAEEEIKVEMDAILAQMQADLARIESYETELGVTSSLDGDKLVNPRGDVPQDALLPIAGDVVVGGVQEGQQSSDAVPLALRTDWLNPRGFDFDWRNTSVYDGHLNDVVPLGRKYGEYLAERAAAEGGQFQSSNIVWSLSDGRLLADAVASSTATVMEPLTSLRTNLETAYATYFKDKETYQVKYPLELLGLEISLRNVETTYSVNDSEDALLVY